MANSNIKELIKQVVKKTFQGVVSEEPETKVTCAADFLTDEEKSVNEVLEEEIDKTLHVETTLRLYEPIKYISVTFTINE